MSSFLELGVPARLNDVLAATGIETPTPIQHATLPDALAGRDLLGRGRTGSGKTLAFLLPIVARLSDGARPRGGAPRALILAPTRELVGQIDAALRPLAEAAGLTSRTVFGGVGQGPQVTAIRRGVDIVVACPGRLEDLIEQGHCSLARVEITVLDEADHMADLGFLPAVRRILARTPAGGQRMLFSATLDRAIDSLVKQFLVRPVTHQADSAQSPVSTMTHHVFHVSGAAEKNALVHRLASGTGRRILFMRTKHQARKLARQLTDAGVPSVDLHGNLSQPARDRNLAAFSTGEARVLVATDIAARGVHVDEVELVVHVDPPAEHKAYLHRSGRTARAGSAGDVVTVVLPEQRKDAQQLLRKAGITARPQEVVADSASVQALVGEIAPYRAPAPTEAPAPRGGNRPAKTATAGQAQRRRRRSGGQQAPGRTQGGRSQSQSGRSQSGRSQAR